MTYKEFCKLKANDPNVNIFPNTILGSGWYISYPCSRGQANTEIVASILMEYEYAKAKERLLIRLIIVIAIISLAFILSPLIMN